MKNRYIASVVSLYLPSVCTLPRSYFNSREFMYRTWSNLQQKGWACCPALNKELYMNPTPLLAKDAVTGSFSFYSVWCHPWNDLVVYGITMPSQRESRTIFSLCQELSSINEATIKICYWIKSAPMFVPKWFWEKYMLIVHKSLIGRSILLKSTVHKNDQLTCGNSLLHCMIFWFSLGIVGNSLQIYWTDWHTRHRWYIMILHSNNIYHPYPNAIIPLHLFHNNRTVGYPIRLILTKIRH